MTTCLSFLNNEEYQTYNRRIAKFCGSVDAAIMISELINRFEYHTKNNELTSHSSHGDNWFYYTIELCEERTCLSRKQQDAALNILIEKGLIEKKSFGVPAKRHFRINEEKILELYGLSKRHSSLYQSDKLDCTNRTNQFVPTGQTIYKNSIEEPQEEPQLTTTTTSSGFVVDEVEIDKSIEATEQAAQALQAFLQSRAEIWDDPKWNVSLRLLLTLMKCHGIAYVSDQVTHMIQQEMQAIKDEKTSRKDKTKRISKPESYLRLACEKNFALAEKEKK